MIICMVDKEILTATRHADLYPPGLDIDDISRDTFVLKKSDAQIHL